MHALIQLFIYLLIIWNDFHSEIASKFYKLLQRNGK